MADQSSGVQWTIADLVRFPDDGGWTRYEIIDGELFVSETPGIDHQLVLTHCLAALCTWDEQHRLGMVLVWPGVILSNHDSVIPDVVWISRERLAYIPQFHLETHRRWAVATAPVASQVQTVESTLAIVEGADDHLHGAPELVVEVLSPGAANERRDRGAKLRLYSVHGVHEYWIVDYRALTVEVYRRRDAQLRLEATVGREDTLTSPMLPGFALPVAQLFRHCRGPRRSHQESPA
jgi:Uma2 family endonuclease